MGTLWYALENSLAYDRFVLTKIVEASFKADAAPGTNDPVLFKTPSGEQYWTSADWLLAFLPQDAESADTDEPSSERRAA